MIEKISSAFQTVKTYFDPPSWATERVAQIVSSFIERIWRTHSLPPSFEKRLSAEEISPEKPFEINPDQKAPTPATVIQKAYRDYRAFSLFEQANHLMATVDVRCFPRATNGRTPVYFPDSSPDIVFKESGIPQNRERLRKMIQARRICKENAYQHLEIPAARTAGGFLIEQRLPVERELSQKTQLGLYIEYQECFTQAAIELTSFLCQAKVPDLSGQTKDPWQSLCNTSIPRHDNAIIYLDKHNQGKIGLVDLEDFQQMPNAFNACMHCIRFFPYHLEQILSAAKKFDPEIEKHLETFKKERGFILDYFEKAYGIHREFVARNHIDLETPLQQLSFLTLEEKNVAAALMTEILGSRLKDLSVIKTFEDVQLLNLLASISPEQQEAFCLERPTSDKELIIPTEILQKIFPEMCDISLELINE
ncbi:MAG: hypothetical protein K2X08_07065, partial [Chlamydiales bacterium]|nr:hypothetical protein [Chlamydiales bacterium]